MSEPVSAEAGVPSPKSPGKRSGLGKPILVILSLLITGAAVWFLARHNNGFSFEQFVQILGQVHPGWLFLALVCGIAAYVFRALRWESFIASYAPGANRIDLLGNTLIGFAAVVILGRPAELVRPYLIARQIQKPFPSQAGTWFLERIYDLLSILVLAAWALLTIDPNRLSDDSPVTLAIRAGGGIVLAASVAAITLLIVFTFAAERARDRLSSALAFLPEAKRSHVDRLLDAFVSALSVSRNPKSLQGIVGWTIVHWAFVGVGTWAVFQSFPTAAGLGIAEALRFLALLALASAVPLPGLVGSYFLVSALLLTEWLGLPLEGASGVTALLWAFQMGISLPLGALAALRSGLNWRKIKSMEQEAHL